ncbi:hypothetical protein BJY52DRAFT_951997 [Lactarius psammicola]|nr:hypothetical protein BJY52DRAFT_951997 [Lactarius psammicola]
MAPLRFGPTVNLTFTWFIRSCARLATSTSIKSDSSSRKSGIVRMTWSPTPSSSGRWFPCCSAKKTAHSLPFQSFGSCLRPNEEKLFVEQQIYASPKDGAETLNATNSSLSHRTTPGAQESTRAYSHQLTLEGARKMGKRCWAKQTHGAACFLRYCRGLHAYFDSDSWVSPVLHSHSIALCTHHKTTIEGGHHRSGQLHFDISRPSFTLLASPQTKTILHGLCIYKRSRTPPAEKKRIEADPEDSRVAAAEPGQKYAPGLSPWFSKAVSTRE